MSAQTIFLVDGQGNLARMRPGVPTSEDKMQALVAKYPELIADSDGGLLLIRREQPIADSLDNSGRWSVDHLFVTRDAVPVLVELKRASDTRLRREVVGQMLDYAANAVAHWPAGRIAAAFNETWVAAESGPDALLHDFIGDMDPSSFWDQVDANFSAGRIKLVFVADVVPRELARIVEFLNEQMKADVRAVELRWFEGENDVTTLVPRVIGETQRATAQKQAARSAPALANPDEFIATYLSPLGNDYVKGAEAFIALVERLGGYAEVGKGSIIGCFKTEDGRSVFPLHLWKDGGYLSLSFRWLGQRRLLATDEQRRRHYEEFTDVVGPLSTKNLNGFPAFRVSCLADGEIATRLEPVMRSFISAVKST